MRTNLLFHSPIKILTSSLYSATQMTQKSNNLAIRRHFYAVTWWPWPLTIWPWMFVAHRMSRVETVYKIWAKSNNPRLSFRPTFKGGTSEWLSGVRGVRDWTVPNLGRGHYRCSPNLFYISDICILRHNAGGSKASVENWGQIPHFLPHTVEIMEGWPRWWTAEMSDWKNIDLVQRKV